VAIVLLACRQYETHAALGGGTNIHNHSSAAAGGTTINTGTISVSGNLTSTHACETGYTRIGLDLCHESVTYTTTTGLTRDACTAITAPSSSARSLIVGIFLYAKSANVAATLRTAQITVYTDAGCTAANATATNLVQVLEFAATLAGTTIAAHHQTGFFVPLPSTGATVYFMFSDDAGNQGTASYRIRGYYD